MWTFHTCNADALLFAQVGQFLRWDVCLPAGLLIGVIVLGIWVVARIRQWRVELLEEQDALPEELTLEHFQQLFDEGLLDPEEFERIKARLQAAAPKPENANPSTDQPPDTSFQKE
jgi:tetrahydromethanopterin S-methyltransferase subunit G